MMIDIYCTVNRRYILHLGVATWASVLLPPPCKPSAFSPNSSPACVFHMVPLTKIHLFIYQTSNMSKAQLYTLQEMQKNNNDYILFYNLKKMCFTMRCGWEVVRQEGGFVKDEPWSRWLGYCQAIEREEIRMQRCEIGQVYTSLSHLIPLLIRSCLPAGPHVPYPNDCELQQDRGFICCIHCCIVSTSNAWHL